MPFHVRRLLGCLALISGVQQVSRLERVTLDVSALVIPLIAGIKCVPHL